MNLATLENDLLEISIDTSTGALVEFRHKPTDWRVQNRGHLARAFSVVAPLPERLLNEIDGTAETVSVEAVDGRIAIVWNRLVGPHCGPLDIKLAATVSLDAYGARFDMVVENNSPFTVESVRYPYVGDLSRPTGSERLWRLSPGYCGMGRRSMYPEFPNERGYWGVDYPIQMVPTPESPFLLVQGEGEGLYIGCHDTSIEERAEYTFQLQPGYSRVGHVPEGGEIGGKDSFIEFSMTHLPFVRPGDALGLAPIVLRPYEGDWHAGADIYKQWRSTWMRKPPVPAWLADVHSWQQIQMTSWGDSLRIPFAELVEYGKECAEHGVGAIQLVGWTLYGQDGRLPIHDIEPRLGSRRELKDAIRTLDKMGVKVVLYEKYTCADVGTDEYKDELHAYASKDMFGNTHGHGGWRYHTPAHLSGINTRPYAWMCMHSEGWQDCALAEVAKSLDLEPAGILLDECQWHGDNGFYCFDPGHGHPVPAYNFGGDAAFERRLRALLDEKNADLVLAGEGPWDLQYRSYNLAYHRARVGHVPGIRYIDPFLPMMSFVHGYDDRESINICLLYRYIISYEPLNFKGRLEDFPLTLEYGRKVDALRRRYREYLWDAEFRDTVGLTVHLDATGGRSGTGSADTPPDSSLFAYATYRNVDSGKRSVILVNHHAAQDATIRLDPEPPVQAAVLVTPEDPEPTPTPRNGDIVVPARSAVVVLER